MITRSVKRVAIVVIQKAIREKYFQKDPISLELIKIKFILIRNNCKHTYDAYNLFQYILSSGDFTDPITRIAYDSCELLRLEHILRKPAFYLSNKKDELQAMRKHYFTIMGLCDVFEIEMMEQVSSIREQIHDTDFDLKFRFDYVPLIIQCFENYRTVHKERCFLTLQNILKNLNETPLDIYEVHLRLCNILDTLSDYCNASMYELSASS